MTFEFRNSHSEDHGIFGHDLDHTPPYLDDWIGRLPLTAKAAYITGSKKEMTMAAYQHQA